MLLKRAPEGTGVIAGGASHPCRVSWYQTSVQNPSEQTERCLMATIEGLRQLKTPEEVAKLRGKSVDRCWLKEEMKMAKHFNMSKIWIGAVPKHRKNS